jgi:hypothetical protein
LIHGEGRADRLRDDKPTIAAVPLLPPGVSLTVAESQMWDYLIANVYQVGVHGTGDGAAFLKVARLWARVNEIDEQLRLAGVLIDPAPKSPTSHKVLHPLARLSRDLWQQLGTALADIGATPSGRVRLAGPRRGGDGDSWGTFE